MKCNSCGNEYAYRITCGTYKNEHDEMVKFEVCDRCGKLSSVSLPDVSAVHEPYLDTNLCDKQHRNGHWITSRRQKAEVLDKLGLREKRESNIPYIKDKDQRRAWFKKNFADA